MKPIEEFSVLYIDRIPDEINSTIWMGSCQEMVDSPEEGSDRPILRDACRQDIHAVSLDIGFPESQTPPSCPTVYVRMAIDQRQMMVFVPYRVPANMTKFYGANCRVQDTYVCDRPIDRKVMCEILQKKAKTFNSILFADGYIESNEAITEAYDQACASIMEAYCINGRVKRPHRIRGSIFPVETFHEEMEERHEEVVAKRGASYPSPLYRHRTVQMIDGFPSNRPCVMDAGEYITVYRRVPHFNLEMSPSGWLDFSTSFERLRHVRINDIHVNPDERRQGFGSIMLHRLSRICCNMRATIDTHPDNYELIAFIQSSTGKAAHIKQHSSGKIRMYFDTNDIIPYEKIPKKNFS